MLLARVVFFPEEFRASRSSSISLRAGDDFFLVEALLAAVFLGVAFLAVAFFEAFFEAFLAGLLLELSAMCNTVPRDAKESICNEKEALLAAVCPRRVF